jgi:hypothetical protein
MLRILACVAATFCCRATRFGSVVAFLSQVVLGFCRPVGTATRRALACRHGASVCTRRVPALPLREGQSPGTIRIQTPRRHLLGLLGRHKYGQCMAVHLVRRTGELYARWQGDGHTQEWGSLCVLGQSLETQSRLCWKDAE